MRGKERGELRKGGKRGRTAWPCCLLFFFLFFRLFSLFFFIFLWRRRRRLLLLLRGELGSQGAEALFGVLHVVDQLLDLQHLVLSQGTVLGKKGGREGGRERGKEGEREVRREGLLDCLSSPPRAFRKGPSRYVPGPS